MSTKILLSHREALALLQPNFSDYQLRRLARAGLVPGYRPPMRRGTRGGKAVYERAALLSWIAQGLPFGAAASPALALAPSVAVPVVRLEQDAPRATPCLAAPCSGDHRRFGRFRRPPE